MVSSWSAIAEFEIPQCVSNDDQLEATVEVSKKTRAWTLQFVGKFSTILDIGLKRRRSAIYPLFRDSSKTTHNQVLSGPWNSTLNAIFKFLQPQRFWFGSYQKSTLHKFLGIICSRWAHMKKANVYLPKNKVLAGTNHVNTLMPKTKVLPPECTEDLWDPKGIVIVCGVISDIGGDESGLFLFIVKLYSFSTRLDNPVYSIIPKYSFPFPKGLCFSFLSPANPLFHSPFLAEPLQTQCRGILLGWQMHPQQMLEIINPQIKGSEAMLSNI